jgi:hypothetical protein
MRICEIEIYRDGGSIEFQVERDGNIKHVWLNTPFDGEPRALRINASPVGRGDSKVTELLDDIEEWWLSLPPDLQKAALEAQAHVGPYRNPSADVSRAIDVTRVLLVRDYTARNYLTERSAAKPKDTSTENKDGN